MRRVVAVGLLSGSALAYEVLLMRLFSVEQWHHFAYLIIALALLGYGASGTVISLFRAPLLARFDIAFPAAAAAFAVTAPGAFAAARSIPLNTLELFWDASQQVALLGVWLVLAVPFFCAATAIGLALARRREDIGDVYRGDLVGAGLGAAGAVGVLFVLDFAAALRLVGGLGMVAAAVGLRHRGPGAWRFSAFGVAAVVSVVAWPDAWLTPTPSPYKGLSQALRVPQARVIGERSGPLGLVTAVDSPAVPFRHAPGLSLNAVAEVPEQVAIFVDGDAMTAATRFDGDTGPLAYLDRQPAALPYHLLQRPRVLVLGVGGGADVLRARLHGAARVDAVEINPDIVDLLRNELAGLAGPLLAPPRVRLHVAEARDFAAGPGGPFDLIQIGLLDSFTAAGSGLQALDESALYTVDAMVAYLDRLAPGGFLAISRWLKTPPRDSLRLVATAVEALRRRGVDEAAGRLAVIRDWRTATLLIKNGRLDADDLAGVRFFARERAFDVAYLPGLGADEANRFNVLDGPQVFRGATALVGPDGGRFSDSYKFDVTPTTDDRPYFFHFLKWRVLGEIIALPGGGGLALAEWGLLVLLAVVGQATVVSLVLILLPLVAMRRRTPTAAGGVRFRVALYFLALGLAFLFIEMASIQRFVLYLGHPLYAVAWVLAAFLVCAGLGSGAAPGLARRLGGERPALVAATLGIAISLAFYLSALPAVLDASRLLPQVVRLAASLLFIAPLAFCMGMPFPLGLARTADVAPELVPWAWALNGCASVIGAASATLLAIQWGFAAVIGVAALLYGLAAMVWVAGRGRSPV